jgi:hypothetical protein
MRGWFRLTAAALLLGALTAPVWSASLTVTYVEGRLELKQGSGWTELGIGDMVADTATVQFDGDGVAELEGAGVTVTLRQAGAVALSDVMAKSKEVAASGLGSMVKGRVAGVFQGPQKGVSTVMGVRASQAATEQVKVDWIGNATELLEEARKALAEGTYEKALNRLDEAWDYASETEEPMVMFYMGYANAMLGRNAKALDALNGSRMDPASVHYGDFLILRGQLLVEALSFRDAFSAFDSYRASFPTGSDAQLANLMAGYCATQFGDRTEAQRSLALAQRTDPASDFGKKAGELLGQL